ncbi:MAG: hypothetical protein A2464_03370 [Deltaproteobacteria bacterium RIFOXYC2_FULL_48_10]|nr:MAG: hypothetical protein A2464_03370 [Deltaproteobacteria bacterium RIFOXYC2_FULL_48_10]
MQTGYLIRWMALIFILWTTLLWIPSTTMAFNRLEVPKSNIMKTHGKEFSKIQRILNQKIADKALLKKAESKLSTLNDKEMRLISSLCDRIPQSDSSAGADVAFLLVATLIIFS